MKKLAIVTTHPIQYNAPWFRLLAQRNKVQVKVFYTWSQTKESVKDKTFGKNIKWDIPLLDGYDFQFVDNVSKNPGSHHFFGIICPTLIRDIENFQPNAILFFGWKFKSHFLAMRHFKGKIPIWFRGDSTLLDEVPGFKSKLRRVILKNVYSYIDKAFYVGEASKAYFLKHSLKEKLLVYAPHSVDNSRFFDDEFNQYKSKAQLWRKELGYEDSDIVIVFAGKFESKKQPYFLINAFNELKMNRLKSLKLLLVGNGPLELTLYDLSKNHTDIQFLPFQNQTIMPIVYRLGNIFCLPSKGPGETWGLAVNEAMACGIPVIVSNKVGCAEDLVKQNVNGYIFESNSKDDLIHILESIELDKLKKLGDQAKTDIQKYNFQSIVGVIENELSKI